MSALVFVDTNVLLYEWDSSEAEKQKRSVKWLRALWSARCGRTSFQVLAEFYVAATRKLSPPVEPERAQRYARTLFSWQPVTTTAAVLEGAWVAQQRHQLSWWDSLIVSAARTSGCRCLLSEDFQHGQDLAGLRVVSPFKAEPLDVLGPAANAF